MRGLIKAKLAQRQPAGCRWNNLSRVLILVYHLNLMENFPYQFNSPWKGKVPSGPQTAVASALANGQGAPQ